MHLNSVWAISVFLILEAENKREAQEPPKSRYTDSCKKWQLSEIEKYHESKKP